MHQRALLFSRMFAGYLASLGYVLLLAVGTFCFGYAARRSTALYVLWVETLLGAGLILPLLLLLEHHSLPELLTKPRVQNWAWLSAAALFGFGGGNYFSLINLKTAGEQTNSLLSPAITAATVLLSFAVFAERLQVLQWLGIAIVLTVVVYFLKSTIKSSQNISRSKAGALSGIATILFISLSIICSIKGAAEHITILHALFIRLLVAFALVSVVFSIKIKQAYRPGSVPLFAAMLVGVLVQTILSNYLWYYASFTIGVAVFQTLIATLPLWVYAIDVYVLKKSKPSLLFLVMAMVAAIGVCMVML